jgi:hypothetical protein
MSATKTPPGSVAGAIRKDSPSVGQALVDRDLSPMRVPEPTPAPPPSPTTSASSQVEAVTVDQVYTAAPLRMMSLRLPDDLWRRYRTQSLTTGRSMNSLIIEAMERSGAS